MTYRTRRLAPLLLAFFACTSDPMTTDTGNAETGADGGDDFPVITTSGPVGDAGATSAAESTSSGGASDGLDDAGCLFTFCADIPDEPWDCDLLAQDCPRGLKCAPWASNGGPDHSAARCVPVVPDPAAPGQPCHVEGSTATGYDDCELGSVCFDVDPKSNEGTCHPMCSGTFDAPTCDGGKVCASMNYGALPLCVDACDPLAPECARGEGCYAVGDLFVCMSPRIDAGLEPGDPCSDREQPWLTWRSITGCAAGMQCIVGDAFSACADAACCAAICDVSDPMADDVCTGLDPAQTCEPWYDEASAPPGAENIGICSGVGA